MDNKLKLIMTGALIFTLWSSWFFRYDLEVGGDKAFGYLLDRWTGEIEFVYGKQRLPANEQ